MTVAAKKKSTTKKKRPSKPASVRTAAQKAAAKRNLIPPKKGEVRNPKGNNGWTEARRKVKELLEQDAEQLATTLITMAKAGDQQALKLCMGPLLPAQKHEHEHTGEVSFRWEE